MEPLIVQCSRNKLPENLKEVLIFDLEYDLFDPADPQQPLPADKIKLVEMGYVLLRKADNGSWSSTESGQFLFNHATALSASFCEVTSISLDEIQSKEVGFNQLNLPKCCHWASWGGADYKILHANFTRVGIQPPAPVYPVIDLKRVFNKHYGLKNASTQRAQWHCGMAVSANHRALNDAKAVADLFCYLQAGKPLKYPKEAFDAKNVPWLNSACV